MFAVALLLIGAVTSVPAARADDGITVTLHLRGCPQNFDGINASIYDFAANCHTPLGGVNITIEYAGTAPSQQTDLDGNWTFTGVTPGTVTLDELLPDPSLLIRAFCAQYDAATGPGSYLEAPAAQGSASWNLQAGQGLDCAWYNFAPVANTAATVTVRLHACPGSTDVANASIYDLAAACHDTPRGVTMTISAVNGPPRGGQTGADGAISWQGIPSGPVTIQEQLPDGVTAERAFCDQRTAAGDETGFNEASVGADGSAALQLLGGYDELDCDWFNTAATTGTTATDPGPNGGNGDQNGNTGNGGDIGNTGNNGGGGNAGNGGQPSVDATNLTIQIFDCPADYDALAREADPARDCAPARAGRTFTSLGANSGKLATRTTGANGSLTFSKLSAGAHLIAEKNFARSYASAFILTCRSSRRDLSGYPLSPFAFVSPDGALWIDVQKGESLTCTWYNIAS